MGRSLEFEPVTDGMKCEEDSEYEVNSAVDGHLIGYVTWLGNPHPGEWTFTPAVDHSLNKRELDELSSFVEELADAG